MNSHSRISQELQAEIEAELRDFPFIRSKVKSAAAVKDADTDRLEDAKEDVAVSGPTGPDGPIEIESDDVILSPGEALKSDAVLDESVGKSETAAAVAGVDAPLPVPSVPIGYASFPDGIYELPEDESAAPIFICTPLRVDAMFVDQSGRGWGKLISVRAANGCWHDVPVTNADLQRRPGEVIATLVDHGLELATDKRFKERFLNLLKSWRPGELLQTVKHAGWVTDMHDGFILGEKVLGSAKVLSSAGVMAQSAGLAHKGSVEDWKQSIARKCVDNPLMILAVSLAFSGPLLAPSGLMGGGLHFRGASSSGKTTLLNLASSVWGNRQLVSQWRATSNGLEAIAWSRNDMLLPLDEIAEISARDLHNAIYMLANGTGKVRMTKDVTLADQARWRLALISSGEISVEEKLKEAHLGAMAGHEVRLIDIEADSRAYGAFDNLHGAANAASFAEAIQSAVSTHYGAVGREYVHKLMPLFATGSFLKFMAVVDRNVANWMAKLPSAPDGQIARVAKRFALIALAGDLATGFGLTGWQPNDASKAAEQAFLDWYDRRYDARREVADSHTKTMQDYLSAHANTLLPIGSAQQGAEPEGWCDGSLIYLSSATWAKLYPGDMGVKAAKALMDMQLLLAGENGRHTRKAPRKIPGRPRLYTVNADRVAAYKAA